MPKGQRKTEEAQARIGEKYGLLTIVEWLGSNKRRLATYKLLCSCGRYCVRTLPSIKRSGDYSSCGCSSNVGRVLYHMKHLNSMRGEQSAEYSVWVSMKRRCSPKYKGKDAKWYSLKGIRVCDRWDDFNNFIADMGRRPSSKHEIDRIDPNGNYDPSNCRWLIMEDNRRRANKERFDRENAERYSAEVYKKIINLNSTGISMRKLCEQTGYTRYRVIKCLAIHEGEKA